jgi:broad specificity phosphatase PhoE
LSSTEPTSARIWLIRHAQASFGAANYDALSKVGHEQAARLAAWLVSQSDVEFAHVCRGSLQRHRQTLDAIVDAFQKANRTLPEVHEDADWNEFDHDAIVRAYATTHSDDLVQAVVADPGNRRAVHSLLAASLGAWSRRELDASLAEPWDAFTARVARARDRVMKLRGKVLTISSAGPIARCAQAALECSNEKTVKLNIGLRNTAISEFRSRAGGWDMQIWNMLPHLSAPGDHEVVTYY